MQAHRALPQWLADQSLDEFLRHPHVQAALEQLGQARSVACAMKLDVWAMAVEMSSLVAAGCTTTQLRLLVATGYVEHAEEVTQSADMARSFRPENPLKLGLQSCFVLTEDGANVLAAGVFLAYAYSAHSLNGTSKHVGHQQVDVSRPPSTPSWNQETRELRVGAELVKQFRRPAPSLELVLSAFQEMNWPLHLDDPLPPKQGIIQNERLRDTIRRLNRCQKPHLVHFASNGLGSGIRWTWLKETPRKTHG